MTTKEQSGKPDADNPAAAWLARAAELAEWTERRLVNRTDAWGAYRREEDIGKEYTRQDGSKGKLGEQETVKGRLARAILVRHFKARLRASIIGLHSADKDNLTKWGALDIDHHGPTSTAPDANLHAALAWYAALTRLGFQPLLTESNGKGGYHLRILLAEPTPADRLFHFLRRLTADHVRFCFPKAPEQFPKQPDVQKCSKGFGNWLRLPGRHHKRDYWSRVWNGERWLDGAEAIDFMLALTGDPPSLVPPPPPPRPQRQPRRTVGRPDNLSARINAYMRKLPNAGEGGGRDDIAFYFAAWLVRDMALPDDIALDWLCQWDAGNRPPKGRECLAEILKNAHAYGRHAVGSGRTENWSPSTPSVCPTSRPGHYILRAQVEV